MNGGTISPLLSPADEGEATAIVAAAGKSGQTLRIAGGDTRRGLGRPVSAHATLSSAALTGITLYEPAELVIRAKAGTPLREIEATLAENGQMLSFEPMDHRPLFGGAGEPTIGAVAAGNFFGPRRIRAGAARDSLLGIRIVNGRGEIIKSGGRVMKNVTGLDLTKVICGAYGTLGFITEVVFKVLPRPQRSATLAIDGLSDGDAIVALTSALGSPFEPSGAAHLPATHTGAAPRTLIRVEGFSDAVDYRLERLRAIVGHRSETQIIDDSDSLSVWASMRDAKPLATDTNRVIWRISTVPGSAPSVTAAIAVALPSAIWFYDLGGGLIWLSVEPSDDGGAGAVRTAVGTVGGHATLVRGPDEIRRSVPVFQPLAEPLTKLTAGIKRSFDPAGIFEPGRMYADL